MIVRTLLIPLLLSALVLLSPSSSQCCDACSCSSWRRQYNDVPQTTPAKSRENQAPRVTVESAASPRGNKLFKMSVRNNSLVDGLGRTTIFHGFNAVMKQWPWYPEQLLNDTKMRYYQQWGFNVIRLGTMWAGAQPRPGAEGFNHTYLDVLEKIISKAASYGFYIILDMHQDVLSSAFSSYDGVPRWLVDSFPPPSHPFPYPLTHLRTWPDAYLSQAVGEAFQHLYQNVSGAVDNWAKFWQTVAQRFGGYQHVLGYELINEPWAGDIYAQPDLLLPGEAGRKNLQPVYEKLSKAIRQVDNTSLVFYEPVTWGLFMDGQYMGSGFTSVPGGPLYENRSVLSYHYYCWTTAGSENEKDRLSRTRSSDIQPKNDMGRISDTPRRHAKPRSNRVTCDQLLGPAVFANAASLIRACGGGSFLTEFGTCEPDECQFAMDQADLHLQSWTYWDSNFFNDSGAVNWDVVRLFSRPYPRAVTGRNLSFSFETTGLRKFSMKYDYYPTVGTGGDSFASTTEVFIPPVYYPVGFTVRLTDNARWSYDIDESLLVIWPRPNLVNVSTIVLIVISK